MKHKLNRLSKYIIIFSFFVCSINVQANTKINLQKLNYKPGAFPVYVNQSSGNTYLMVKELNQDFLFVSSLSSGIGSNDIGLDRNQIRSKRLVYFKKVNNHILLIQKNMKFRSSSKNSLEKKSITDGFGFSTLAAFPIIKTFQNSYLINLNSFLLSDESGIAALLKKKKQGRFQLSKNKTFILSQDIKAFPLNTEILTLHTFEGTEKEEWLTSVMPEPTQVSLKIQYSFIQLPKKPLPKRIFHPRSGFNKISYYDYSAPLNKPLDEHWIVRHRLEKKYPKNNISEAVKPIIYYLDPGTPEPIRSALLEGARWWDKGFEAAGFKHAFKVKLLPKNADPLDMRYNMIHWTHRSTRGWSYGQSIIDPRSGEILKGNVLLGSLRVRQDMKIFQGLLNAFDPTNNQAQIVESIALNRLKQLSAHEIGHTLGLQHNFSSSSDNRSSVMDYPHPQFSLDTQQNIVLDDVYDTKGIGLWDIQAIKYGYSTFENAATEKKELKKILKENDSLNLSFITDRDARPLGSMHPKAHLWDNGTDSAKQFKNILEIRKLSLDRITLNSLPDHRPISDLENVLVPIYFFHRYQLNALVKWIGGQTYRYQLKGENVSQVEYVSPEKQRMALNYILETLEPEFLAIPKPLINLMSPTVNGFTKNREFIQPKTGLAFDPFAFVSAASHLSTKALLHPERVNRLAVQSALNPKQLNYSEVLEIINKKVFKTKSRNTYHQHIINLTQTTTLYSLMNVLRNPKSSVLVKAETRAFLKKLHKQLSKKTVFAHNHYQVYLASQILAFFEDGDLITIEKPTQIPPGSPIGCSVFH